ncbi:MAG: site-specific integrase [Methylococcales bacterium]|nr:site-specific integrase [Methylococcales bacterium]
MQVTLPNGKRIQQSAGTDNKQQAQELHDTLKAQLWRESKLGEKPKYSWEQAVIRWMTEQSHKRSLIDDKRIFNWLHDYLHGVTLESITKVKIEQIKQVKIDTGVTNATVNRMLALLRSVLNRAEKEWEWIDKSPHVRLLPEEQGRVRWLTFEESERLLAELPEHLAAMARFTLATGLRASNVSGLEWSQIDMQRRCAWIYADQAKGKKSIAVPLNNDALTVIRSQIGKHPDFVFTYKGNPILGQQSTKAWWAALKRAGIENFRWHDLRHTWASWHIQNGTPIHILQELGGWSDSDMVKRYAHLSPLHLSGYASNVDAKSMHPQKSPANVIRCRA